MAELIFQKRGGMLFPLEEEGRAFVRGLDAVAKLKVARPREKRRDILNRLSHAIYREAVKLIGHGTEEDEKAFCKLHIGIPILIHDPEDGEECMDYYRRLLEGIPYEDRLERMKENHRFYIPVTSIMDDRQLLQYVKQCVHHYGANHGVVILTPKEKQWLHDPEMQRDA